MGLIEECAGVDGKVLSEVIIPMMNVSRRCLDGTVQNDESLNKSQIYVNFYSINIKKLILANLLNCGEACDGNPQPSLEKGRFNDQSKDVGYKRLIPEVEGP